jgi:hypothetical protein
MKTQVLAGAISIAHGALAPDLNCHPENINFHFLLGPPQAAWV